MIWTIKYIDYPWGSSTASRPWFKLHDTPLLWKCVRSRSHHYLGSFPLPAIAPSFPSWLAAFISLFPYLRFCRKFVGTLKLQGLCSFQPSSGHQLFLSVPILRLHFQLFLIPHIHPSSMVISACISSVTNSQGWKCICFIFFLTLTDFLIPLSDLVNIYQAFGMLPKAQCILLFSC